MSPRELAVHYEAKVFETREAAEAAGFVVTETMSPRNAWNRSSAAQSIMYKLLALKKSGEAAQIGLVLEGYNVSGCYKKG